MKKAILLTIFMMSLLFTEAQIVGNPFPELSAEKVDDKIITIPNDTKDKYTLVGLAYSKKAEKDLSTWLSPVYQTFVYRPEKPGLFSSFAYDINVYLVPMFTGIKAAGQGAAKRKAAEELDPKLIDNILFFKGSLKPYRDALQLDNKKVPYFFVVDKTGKVVYSTSGKYTEKKMDNIEDQIVKD